MSARNLLLPFSFLYGAGVIVRNWLFDIGLLAVHKVSVPVISVGNVSAGGVGKTPLVEFLATKLRKDYRVAVISRGYGRKSTGYLVVSNGRQRCAEAWKAGDEASQLAEKLNEVVVVVDEKRARAAEHVVRDFQATVIILDDGFQHRYLHRDLNIVVLSYKELTNRDALLPAGNRREPLSSLLRADLIGISRCANRNEFENAQKILQSTVVKPMFAFRTRVKKMRSAETRKEVQQNWDRPIAFSGIGEPSAFEETLKSNGVNVGTHLIFRDHHWYSVTDLQKIRVSSNEFQADAIITTEKDVARLDGDNENGRMFLKENPVYYVEIEPEIIAGEEILNQQLERFGYAHRNN